MFTLAELEAAHAARAPGDPADAGAAWPLLARRLGAEAIVKHENHNPTGAFKVRGGLTFIDRAHRAGAANAGDRLGDARQSRPEPRLRRRSAVGVEPIIYVPLRQFGREERGDARVGRAARRARRGFPGRARRGRRATPPARGCALVPSFHRDLVRGVATYALELLRAHPDLDVLYVPIGQGSGICGAVAARDALRPADRDRRRAGRGRAGLCPVLRRRPRGLDRDRRHARRRHGDARRPTRRRSTSSCAARRPHRRRQRRRDRRSDAQPIGRIRTISPRARARRPLAAAMQEKAQALRPQGRPRALRRQHRFRSVSKLDRHGSASS